MGMSHVIARLVDSFSGQSGRDIALNFPMKIEEACQQHVLTAVHENSRDPNIVFQTGPSMQPPYLIGHLAKSSELCD